MSEYQVMRWREIPSMVMARDGADTIKVMLPARFQEAIDEAGIEIHGLHQMKFPQLLLRALLRHSKKSFLKVSYKQFLMQ
jgi:hypothetical protein